MHHVRGRGAETNAPPTARRVLLHFDAKVAHAAFAQWVEVSPHSPPGTRLVARVSPRSRIAMGKETELAVDTRRLYFFDPSTGEAI